MRYEADDHGHQFMPVNDPQEAHKWAAAEYGYATPRYMFCMYGPAAMEAAERGDDLSRWLK